MDYVVQSNNWNVLCVGITTYLHLYFSLALDPTEVVLYSRLLWMAYWVPPWHCSSPQKESLQVGVIFAFSLSRKQICRLHELAVAHIYYTLV